MKILITGGAGYLGRAITNLLSKSAFNKITVLDNLLYGQDVTGLSSVHTRFVNGDVRDQAILRPLVETADIIIHLAAIVGAPACDKNPQLAVDVNTTSVRLLRSLVSPSQRIIFPNTNSGYGTVVGNACTEDTPLRPISLYGRTKQDAEDVIMTHRNATCLRLATVFGVSPRMRLDLLVNSMTYSAFFDKSIEVFDGDLRRNFVHVQDVALCIGWCCDNEQATRGQVFNFGLDSANMTKMALASLIGKRTGAVISTGAGSDPDQRNYEVSSKKLADRGFRASRSLEDGIDELIAFYGKLPADKMKRDELTRHWNTTNPCQALIPSQLEKNNVAGEYNNAV